MDALTRALRDSALNTNGESGLKEKLIIAVDFGTTYSGVAYCFANQRHPMPVAVLDWPGSRERVPKVPTLISYSKGSPDSYKWGALVDPNGDNIVGIKLMLDPKQERPLFLPLSNLKKEIKALPKSPEGVAADFLSALYQHALSVISSAVPKGYFALCEKEFVLSVPAVWSDTAKNATLKAAEIAGITPVTLIKEPEAAALYTAKNLDFSIYPDNAFVICDAGGGTVDLISYEVEAVLPRLKLKELVPGTGGISGSLGLNKRFEDAVKNLVGDDQWFSLNKSKAFAHANRQFDNEVKRTFKGEAHSEFFINFPTADLEDDPDSNLEACTWTMSGDDLNVIYEPLILDILRLIDQQVQLVRKHRKKGDVDGIFLVGGFGGSQYLKDRVERAHPDIQIIQAHDSWAAIVKGAALSKLPREAIVTSTASTRHYGVEANSVYQEKRDHGQRTHRCRRTGMTQTLIMTWYIGIGDDLLRDTRIKFPFLRNIDKDYDASDLIWTDRLYQCEDKIAPIHRRKGQKVSLNCTVVADLSGVSVSKFHRRLDICGNAYWEVSYDLVLTLDSAMMKFSLEMGGVSMGSVEATFD